MRVDLHTHSYASPDGSLQLRDYRRMLESGRLDYIAVTDHDTITAAKEIRVALGDRIIVGEEITTKDGELIGLYLTEAIPAGLSVREAAERIVAQGGLVYVPHPFETVRHGLTAEALKTIAGMVDIVEVYNGRSWQQRGQLADTWATDHAVAKAASSDAHGWYGWGKTYSQIAEAPTKSSLVAQLLSGTQQTRSVGLRGRLYPTLNRWRGRR